MSKRNFALHFAEYAERIIGTATIGTIYLACLTSALPTVPEMKAYPETVKSLVNADLGTVKVVNPNTLLGGAAVALVSSTKDQDGCVTIMSLRLEDVVNTANIGRQLQDYPKGQKIYNQGIGFGRDLVIQTLSDGKISAGDISFLRANFLDRTGGIDAVIEEKICDDKPTARLSDQYPSVGRW